MCWNVLRCVSQNQLIKYDMSVFFCNFLFSPNDMCKRSSHVHSYRPAEDFTCKHCGILQYIPYTAVCLNPVLTRKTIHWSNGQNTWTDTFPKKTSRWPTDTWIDAQRRSSSGKYKSKPHWDTTSHRSEWLKWTNQETIDAGEDVEKCEPSRVC